MMSDKDKQTTGDSSNLSQIGQVFNEMNDGYTDLMDQMVPHYRTLITSMLSHLPSGFNPDSILDLGCGNGNVTAISMTFFSNAQYHLIDASDVMIAECKTRFHNHSMRFEQRLFQKLELEQNAYDLVTAGFSLHHLLAAEKEQFFKKLYASMKEGGIFSCADLFINKESEEHIPLLEEWQKFVISSGKKPEDWDWLIDHYTSYDHPNAFSDQQEWLFNAGFSKVNLTWNNGHWGCLHAYK